MTYTIPKLNFSYGALEPFMDARTVEIHHDKHHQTYVDKLNAALDKRPELSAKPIEELLMDLNAIPVPVQITFSPAIHNDVKLYFVASGECPW